jgi:hypothetical protein
MLLTGNVVLLCSFRLKTYKHVGHSPKVLKCNCAHQVRQNKGVKHLSKNVLEYIPGEILVCHT